MLRFYLKEKNNTFYYINDRLTLHNCSMIIDLNKENNEKELCTATNGYE